MERIPSLLDMSRTRPFRQVSVTSAMLLAQRPMACIVAAANSLSGLVTYVWKIKVIRIRAVQTHGSILFFHFDSMMYIVKLN
ncbi:hypothetical protein DPMN_051864 [Dreissena polymorpha]|uniref:Uncharacterized protein n=1 Tax=Dreissena polymorpha TaxID=45954 RepID=A0A9D4HNR6_DREPO|nr:hypothetical protein DPMN_051864 [Dreissena polymorpha]